MVRVVFDWRSGKRQEREIDLTKLFNPLCYVKGQVKTTKLCHSDPNLTSLVRNSNNNSHKTSIFPLKTQKP